MLRQELDLFVCQRPIRYFEGVPSPMWQPEKVNMVIFRENTEDIYAGIEYMTGTVEAQALLDFLTENLNVKKIRFPESTSLGIKVVSKEGSERLIRAAIQYAIDNKLPSVTLVHKGNIMKFTEGAFKNWGYELAARSFPIRPTHGTNGNRQKERGEAVANEDLKVASLGASLSKILIADNFSRRYWVLKIFYYCYPQSQRRLHQRCTGSTGRRNRNCTEPILITIQDTPF